ncbi:hypothetical protein JF73_06130 [Lactobacillus helsingborgensis]|uniref:Uncharacterized protein n=1 Tax=Lactobacillus helsingborgensis TaxID=1218494 RepID=A0AA47B502_9LACO|nr:hypothetical protein [Lactobacillus helsingborgensis]KJY65521.1 hypothetical protein JF73_06130 [Lactobacillus helsingborgensis]UZX30239.1 hypothetical protein LDX53_03300 [Lactobacillus helsingborgensis]
MKLRKTLTWSVVVAALAAASGISVNQTNLVQAATSKKAQNTVNKTKYGFKRDFIFPKSWQVKWYSNTHDKLSKMTIKKNGFITPWTGEYVELVSAGKVKGTNKYLWQMPQSWFTKHDKIFKHLGRVTTNKINNKKWTVYSPIDENNIEIGFAFRLKNEKNAGKTQKVLFEANPKTGEVIDQFFPSAKLAKKYQHYNFKGETYAPSFNQYQEK